MIQNYKIITFLQKIKQIEFGVGTQILSYNDNNLILADTSFGNIFSGIVKYS